MGKNKTVYDIANEAGVSVATVSRVLNNNKKVAEVTRQKVQNIIDKYDFQPNEVARSLFKNQTKMIGCILPDITNPYYSSVFIQAEQYALEHGYTLVLCNAMDQPANDGIYLQTLTERQVDGIIYMGRSTKQPATMDNFEKLMERYREKLPIVMINWTYKGSGCYKVFSDEAQGFGLLLNKIAEKGHKKVVLLGGRQGVLPTDIKRKVYQNAVHTYGFDHIPDFHITSGYSTESGFQSMNRLLDSGYIPTAVLGINDMVSIGALKACHMRGIRVPDEIAMTGFDNIPLAHYVYPSLTTVSHDYETLGKKAIDIIMEAASGKQPDLSYEYPMQYIKGDSF